MNGQLKNSLLSRAWSKVKGDVRDRNWRNSDHFSHSAFTLRTSKVARNCPMVGTGNKRGTKSVGRTATTIDEWRRLRFPQTIEPLLNLMRASDQLDDFFCSLLHRRGGNQWSSFKQLSSLFFPRPRQPDHDRHLQFYAF